MLDRRKEIAIRRVEGATTWAIAVQLVIENGTLCLAGGLLGIPVALGLAALRTALDPSGAIRWIFPMAETVQTIVTVTAFGLAGGLIPALEAARIQPAEVLAHE
jgi:ABC-type antimicrobial peptide transport system permease subunit